ncbi:MAG: hypothetical protein H7Z40_23310 [Phycisphaerae bacterium]|nr:hypothetical protein [Gemmatimonadaceae bacterium]
MPNVDAIRWFKTQFHEQIEAAIVGTPFTVDFLTALACQETGFIWNVLRDKVNPAELLALCVGDTLDAPRRSAFPKTKSDLLAKTNGAAMFDVAHKALVDMAHFIPSYQPIAKKANKFCHGYGIFQYDLQFFLIDPDYFLQRRYANFDQSLAKAMAELQTKQKKIGLGGRTSLTDMELVAVAIAYNTGSFTPSKGLNQGFKSEDGRFYGQAVFDFLRLAQSVSVDPALPLTVATPGTAPLPAPTPVTATGELFEVEVLQTPLNVRREAIIPATNNTANIIAKLPDGHRVRAVSSALVNGFLELETSLNGAFIHGFAKATFLKPATDLTEIEVVTPAAAPPTSGITAVFMPFSAGLIVRRTGTAGPHSLNEAGQPTRTGDTAEARRAELAAIIEWLAVDKAAHKRYQPNPTATFCNIYAHDYCHLAGCYLPRVWWSARAIEALAQGQTVAPKLGATIDEQRANDLFRWLRDFGIRFGWRRTGTLTKLQTEVNQGAIGLIIAKRRIEGRSGHIVPVVPETALHSALRNTAGDVVRPLQSQAGATNFRYGVSTLNWWIDEKFEDSAFWIHA